MRVGGAFSTFIILVGRGVRIVVRRVPNSGAVGYAILKFMPESSTIYYKLVVSNIYGPVAAHIHGGAPSGFPLDFSPS